MTTGLTQLQHQTVTRPAVEIIGVRKQFAGRSRRAPGRLALDGFDLTVRPGEFLCLLGPSGCGKSTLLNMLAGFSHPDSGQVLVDGTPVTGPGPERGVLFQTPMLFPWLSTLDNVLYGPRARHELTTDVRERALHLLEIVGLADSRHSYPHELSGGMRHRAAFARVLVNQPTLLLMDEPFGALDAFTRVAMQRFLLQLWQRDRITVWFGIGESPKFILILIGVIPIMIIATVSALDSVPPELVQASRSLGASPLWSLVTVRLRSALPPIITGMRLAMGGAWTSIVAVELIAATSGLGYVINNAGVNLQTPLVLSGILSISVLGILFDSLLRLLRRVADPTVR